MKWTKLSCHDFVDNQVRLQLFVLADNLGNFLRRLVLPAPVKHWTITTMREKLIKIGAKGVAHSRYVFFQMAELAAPRQLFGAILDRIQRLRAVPIMASSAGLDRFLKMAYAAVIDGGCPVPTVTNEAERPPLYSGECPVFARKEPKP